MLTEAQRGIISDPANAKKTTRALAKLVGCSFKTVAAHRRMSNTGTLTTQQRKQKRIEVAEQLMDEGAPSTPREVSNGLVKKSARKARKLTHVQLAAAITEAVEPMRTTPISVSTLQRVLRASSACHAKTPRAKSL